MRGSMETTMTAVTPPPIQRAPSPPAMTPPRRPTSIRVKRGMLRRMKTFPTTELASDSTSSHALSVRSGQLETASHDRSSECSGPAGQAKQRLLVRRRRSETSVPRINDFDELSADDVDNNCNVLAEQQHSNQRLDNEESAWINDRLPLIQQHRPLSRHVVYSVQYGEKTSADGPRSLFDRKGSNAATSLVDWPRTGRTATTDRGTNMHKRWSASSPVSLHVYKDPPPKVVSSSRFLLNDRFLDVSTKTRIMSWLESVEVALMEDSVDDKALAAIKEEESLHSAQNAAVTGMNKSV